MSKTLGNCIYLSDSSEEVKRKVMSMYTDPNHIKVEDPGNTKDNPVFLYLEAFVKDEHFKKYWDEYNNLDELKAHYERGGVGDMKVKKFLYQVIEEELEPIRKRRAFWETRIDEVYKILEEGTKKARKRASKTLKDVKKAMQINYFE